MPPLDPYDAVLLLSFGGPERAEEVMPFLRNVTAGRGIPDERLAAVAEHYYAAGGRSPINDQNRALLAALTDELRARGFSGPIGWGNRNWAPYVTDTLRDLADQGAQRVAVLTTSAYSSYSSCRQYREDLAAAVASLASEGRSLAVDRVRAYYDTPGFAAATRAAVQAALEALPADHRVDARIVFVTHSIPLDMAATSGPAGDAYVAQHRELAAIAAGGQPWDLAYCSRSGPPQQPWLEPDVNEHLATLRAQGVESVVIAPIGFVSDHMEVAHDLDTEAMATAAELGLAAERAATVGTAPGFVSGLVDLLVERAAEARGEEPGRPVVGDLGPWPTVCPAGCCPNLRAERPAAAGADWVAPPVGPGRDSAVGSALESAR